MLSFALAACQPVSTASESESGGQPSGQSANNGLAQVVPTEQTHQDIPTTSEQSGVENLPAPVVATGIANNTASATAAAPAAQLSTSDSQGTAGSYTIVDTGQAICYSDQNAISCPQGRTDFYGQDAQYAGNQPSYSLSADGLTVTDNVTGLTWTQSPDLDGSASITVDDKLTFAEAQAYPDMLNAMNYGGYSDWRLPSIKELYSLMDFRGTDPSGYESADTSGLTPFIDTTYFDFSYGDTAAGERMIDAQFWSSNTYLGAVFGDQACAFGLNLADGRIKCYPSGTSGPITKLNYAYFVRSSTPYGVNIFSNNGNGTITDSATGLMWSQDDSGTGMNWQEALAWVAQKNDENYLGYSDWRLPNAKELQSVVDYGRSPDTTNSAAIDPVFNTTQITNEAGQVDYPYFWTSTTHTKFNGSGSDAVYIAFGRALGYMNGSWMDVHGAGAQRSDPKGDAPADYPTGHGPQGDAIRIYNYVRLVRGGTSGDVFTGGEVAPEASSPGGSGAGGSGEPDQGGPFVSLQLPQEAIDACVGLTEGASCTMEGPNGPVNGTCMTFPSEELACGPAGGPGGPPGGAPPP
ncbi:MAG: DUF1566 domain-containing protein [Anaerolineaceae bacterium]|nr:DUF1566 domain-containing protein [Anaerolineaceae bacterium]